MPMRAGTELLITKAASVQFRAPLRLRLITQLPWPVNEDGWAWLSGYELDDRGMAVMQRHVYVRLAGLTVING